MTIVELYVDIGFNRNKLSTYSSTFLLTMETFGIIKILLIKHSSYQFTIIKYQ